MNNLIINHLKILKTKEYLMSYTYTLQKQLHAHLNIFYHEEGLNLNSDEVFDNAFYYCENNDFIKTPSDLCNIIDDYNFISHLESKMLDREIDKSSFITLCNEAYRSLLHDYIISNY